MITFWFRRALAMGAVLVLAVAGQWLAAAGLALVLGLAYAYSVRNYQYVPCWLCSGSGTRSHRGLLAWLFGRALGHCLRCKGDKVNLRWGARMIGAGR